MEQILQAYGLPKETVEAITILYKDTKVKVRSPDGDTEYFDIIAGVLQGETLAPYLFIICLDYMLRTSIDKIRESGFELTKKRGRRYLAKTITNADYADDIVILANTPKQGETLLHSLERGNHRADTTANSVLDLTPDKYDIPCKELKPKINNFLLKKWQQCWNRNTNNKLFQGKPFWGEWRPAFRKPRKEQVTIMRLRIGHSRLTDLFLFSSKNSNHSDRHAKRPAQSNMFSLSVKFLMRESTISTQIP